MEKELKYHGFIQEVLNVEFDLALQRRIELGFGGMKYQIDLADLQRQTFVQVMNEANPVERNNIQKKIEAMSNALNNRIKTNSLVRMIIVFAAEIKVSEINYYKKYFSAKKQLQFTILSLSDIIKLASKHGIDPERYLVEIPKKEQVVLTKREEPIQSIQQGKQTKQGSIQQGQKTTKSAPQKVEVSNELTEYINNYKGAFYSVGCYWSGIGDQKDEFIRDNKWINGPDGKLAYRVNEVEPEDVLILKSTHREGGEGVLKVKAIGIVRNNYKNGTRIDVDWKEIDPVKIPGKLSKLRHRINIVSKEEAREILSYLNDIDFLINPVDPIDQYDKIPFHLDNVECEDKLNREPVAKSLARLINEDIFSQDSNHSFMIHLQGAWGSGKSTFLELLKIHLDTTGRKWIVVDFNAWQNQHISPPWWTIIDQIYRQSLSKLNWCKRQVMRYFENRRRIIKYGRWQKGALFLMTILSLFILYKFGSSFLNVAADYPAAEGHSGETKGIALEVFSKLIVSVGALVSLVYSFSKFIATPIIMRNAKEAESFVSRVADPMQTIKSHYEALVYDVNDAGYDLAIFIDDLDRCNRAYTIELLEGIQTLFKKKRVLYVVAGDKDWISTCFKENYKEFDTTITKSSQKLGELFLEKAFQLSIRMPQISNETKLQYWHHVLGIDEVKEEEAVSEETFEQVKEEIRELRATGKLTDSTQLNSLEEKYSINETVMSDIALEVLDENTKEVKHLLIDHHALIEPNPRAIKRLANEYTMYRNTLWAERRNFDINILFRWLILENRFPVVAGQIKKEINMLSDTEAIKKLIATFESKQRLTQLILDTDNLYGGPMEAKAIADILGLDVIVKE